MNLWEVIDNGNGTVNIQINPDEGLAGLPEHYGKLIKSAVNKYLVMGDRTRIFENEIQLALFSLESDNKEEQLRLEI